MEKKEESVVTILEGYFIALIMVLQYLPSILKGLKSGCNK